MAQTSDGWLWLGTQNGLYQCDGVRFHRQPLPKNRIMHLYAGDNGDLLISYLIGGLSLLSADGRLRHVDARTLAARGNSNTTIARQLGIGENTVNGHMSTVFGKLGATDRTHAVVLALTNGIISA